MLSRYFQQRRCFTDCSLVNTAAYASKQRKHGSGISVPSASWDSFSSMASPRYLESQGLFHQHQQSVLELLHSSFFTNNPLLYVSHYSEFVCVSASSYGPGRVPGMGGEEDLMGSGGDLPVFSGLAIPCYGSNCSLTSRRELVERLESEPIFDYLVQNGVMECTEADKLRGEPSDAKKNLTVLRHVETQDEAVYGLFINALRQTGQHHLANLLDGSARIKALSGSGKFVLNNFNS